MHLSHSLRPLLLSFLLALASAAAASAQGETGLVRVVVRSEGTPVAGAAVRVGSVEVRTDSLGVAALTVPAGSYPLRVEREEYHTTATTLTVGAGETREVSVELEAEVHEEEEIIVTSTRTDRRIEEEPVRVEVISREEVEEKLLMTPGDISMLLNETAGVRVQATSPALGGAAVRIQGLRGRYTQLLSDGLPLYGGQSGAIGPLQIPPMDLGQVEIIKGAASALYGATALGGVVNLISRRPADERELLLNQTTLGGTDAVLWLSGEPRERWGYTLLAGAHRQGDADVDDDQWADLPGYRRGVLRPRIFWSDGAGRSLFATVGAMAEDREGGTVAGGATPAGTPYAEELQTRRLDAGLVGRALLAADRLLTVRGSLMGQRHRHRFGETLEHDRHLTGFAETALSGTSGAHAWVLGAALQGERYRAADVRGVGFTHTVPGVFAQDEVALAEWLTLAASARLDAHSEYGAFVSPRLSALLRPGGWTVRASAGTGWFAPTPFTEETEAVGLTRLEPPRELEAERARTASLDVGYALRELELNATVFGSEVEDAVVVRLSEEGRLSLRNASEPVRTRGTELLARLHAGPVHLTATHVYTRATELEPDGSGRREVPLTPRHAAGVVGAWEAEGRGRIGAELYYTGRQHLEDDPYRSTSEPYLVLGFLVERRVGAARVFLNAENVLDARQTAHDRLVLPARTAAGRWTTDVWAPLEGRVFNAGVRLAF